MEKRNGGPYLDEIERKEFIKYHSLREKKSKKDTPEASKDKEKK